MKRKNTPLQKPAPRKSIKPTVQALRKIHAQACAMLDHLGPKSKAKATITRFNRGFAGLEFILAHLAPAICALERASERQESAKAFLRIEEILPLVETALDVLMPAAQICDVPPPRPPSALFPPLDREVAKKLLQLWKLPKEEQPQAFAAWLESAGTPKLIADRARKVRELLDYADTVTKKTTPRPPRAELCAFVFCDCYEKGRLKRPPPNPEIVAVLPNGDLGYRTATPTQHEAFVAWRAHACRHPEGRVTGGKLGHALPIDVVRDAFPPHRRAFPIFVGKVLNCQPHTRFSHLTLKQVHKLKAELDRLKTLQSGDRKIARELPYLRGQMNQLVRAALKFRKPIAM